MKFYKHTCHCDNLVLSNFIKWGFYCKYVLFLIVARLSLTLFQTSKCIVNFNSQSATNGPLIEYFLCRSLKRGLVKDGIVVLTWSWMLGTWTSWSEYKLVRTPAGSWPWWRASSSLGSVPGHSALSRSNLKYDVNYRNPTLSLEVIQEKHNFLFS